MAEDETNPTINYLRVVNARKWTVVAIVILAIVASFGLDFTKTKMYTASSRIVLIPQTQANGVVVALGPTDVSTDIQVIESQPIANGVEKMLGQVVPPVAVSEVGSTNVVQLSVTSASPSFAASAANAYANEYINPPATNSN